VQNSIEQTTSTPKPAEGSSCTPAGGGKSVIVYHSFDSGSPVARAAASPADLADTAAMRRRLFACCMAAALAALALAACGGGSGQSAEQQVRSVVNQFTVDLGGGNTSAACKLAAGTIKSWCAQGTQSEIALLKSLETATISKVVISGDSATVLVNTGSAGTERITLVNHGGSWLVSGA
jgi:hypothetical protein